ncbi:MAG: hypothetical protein ACI4DR_09785 [Roseburia sp.]
MDYKQEQIFRAQMDVAKMPFYMSYPMQNLYLTEMEYEKDMDRMKELYPKTVGRILECVEEECDKMEYEGSLMFDEYPDRLMLERIVDEIYQKVAEGDEDMEAEQYRGDRRPRRRRREDYLQDLIGVILNNEMYRRRCRHRRCRRWW